MKSDYVRWGLALGFAAAILVLWPDVVQAQSEGQELITGFGEWIIGLLRAGAVILLIIAFIGAVASFSTGNIVMGAWSVFGLIIAGAVMWGAETAVTRIFTL